MAGVCARVGFWGGRTDFSGVKRFGTTDLGKNAQSACGAPGAEASV